MRNLFLNLQDTDHRFILDGYLYSFDASDATIYKNVGHATRVAIAKVENEPAIDEGVFNVIPSDTNIQTWRTHQIDHDTTVMFLKWCVSMSYNLHL